MRLPLALRISTWPALVLRDDQPDVNGDCRHRDRGPGEPKLQVGIHVVAGESLASSPDVPRIRAELACKRFCFNFRIIFGANAAREVFAANRAIVGVLVVAELSGSDAVSCKVGNMLSVPLAHI